MLVLMIFGGRDRRCPVHCASSIIRYQGDVKRAETYFLFSVLLLRLARIMHDLSKPNRRRSTTICSI